MTVLSEPQAREEPQYTATSNLKPVAPAVAHETPAIQPLTRMQGGLLIGLRSAAMLQLRELKILEFVERCEQEIKGGISGSELGGRVSGTRTPKQPEHDRNDLDHIGHRDGYTRELRKVIAALAEMRLIEQKVLLPVGKASEFVAAMVSDLPSCNHCGAVKKAKKPWRLRAGRCIPCYQYRLDHDGVERPKELWAR